VTRWLPLILRNALRNLRRTILTVLSILVSLFLFCSLRTVITSLAVSLESASTARLIVRRATSITFFLPMSFRDRLAQVPGVAEVAWASYFGGIYIDQRHFFSQFPCDPQHYLEVYPEYRVTPEAKEAFRRERTACIVGEKLAQREGFRVGDRITLRGTIFPGNWELTVRGIARAATPDLDTTWLLFNGDYFQERLGRFNQVGWYVVRLKDPARAGEVARNIDATFANSPAETKTETEKAFQLTFITMLGNIKAVVTALGSAIVIAIFLVAMNTRMMAGRERTRELAILKALGFTERGVVALVLAESLLISVVGGALGTGLARLVFAATDFTAGGMLPRFVVTDGTVAWGIVLAVLLGGVSGAAPAWNAARLRVVDALRHQG
jgi:putative ABC transport system permease protein